MHDSPRRDRWFSGEPREIVRILSCEDRCPWDRAQTHQSMRRDLIVEIYEAVETIDLCDPVR